MDRDPRRTPKTAHEKRLAAARQRRWANPYKSCCVCKEQKPNDETHFLVSPRGRVTKTCLECAAEKQAEHGQAGGQCPICDQFAPLVRDTRAPLNEAPGRIDYVRLCRSCLFTINTFDADRLNRLMQYADWRENR